MSNAHDFVFRDRSGHTYRVRLFCGHYWLMDWRGDHWKTVVKLRGDEIPELKAQALPLEDVRELEGGLPWLAEAAKK